MKILHVISTLSPCNGGPTKVCNELAFYQAKHKHEVFICTTNRENPYPKKTNVSTNIPIIQDGITKIFFTAYLPVLFSFSLVLWLIKNISYFDIIHIHGFYRFPTTFAALLSRIVKKPYIIRTQGSLDPFLFKQSRNILLLKRIYEKFFDFPNLNKMKGS